jgi:cell division transport system ATP-binding protein
MLKVRNVSKSFGDIVALEDVTFDVDEGEFLFIVGPSGAGKTTLINLILGKYLPDTGEIIVNEVDVAKLDDSEIPEYRQTIGVVFQDFKVLPERTLRENVEVALAVKGVDESEWEERVNQVLELTGLTERATLFPSQLSGGELQRVSLARALVVNPDIIIADEPTGNLDWETADAMMDLFERINKEGKTVIMATHHQIIIDKLKKRTIELKGGKLSGKAAKKAEKIEKEEEKKKEEPKEPEEKKKEEPKEKEEKKTKKVKVEEVEK